MKRAYAFLSLLIITSALRAPIFAQQPATQSPTITRQSFTAEALRRRLSAIEPPAEPLEEPVLRIETVALRLPDPNRGLGQPKLWLRNLSSVYDTALFQRQRFRETGQPIEFERGRLYFRQDRFVATKGLILYRLWNDRVDLGVYKRSFHGEVSPVRGQALWFGNTDPSGRSRIFSNGRQVFFGLRFSLDKNPR
ncbi:MAG: hypothetical protein AB7U82_08660 [Blastocatellales bacterium]